MQKSVTHDTVVSYVYYTGYLLTTASLENSLTLNLGYIPTYGRKAVSQLSSTLLMLFLCFGQTEPVVFSLCTMRATVLCDGWRRLGYTIRRIAAQLILRVERHIRKRERYILSLPCSTAFLYRSSGS